MHKKVGFLGMGVIFGFALSRVGASEFDLIFNMFTGSDFKLVGVMIIAIVVGFFGMKLLQFLAKPTRSGPHLKISHKKLGRYSLWGATLFGIGWGISGACPGTVLAQLGEGKIYGLFTFAGIICGTYIYARLKERTPQL